MYKIFPSLHFPDLWCMCQFSFAVQQILKISAVNQQFYYVLYHMDQTLRKGTVGMAHFCSTVTGAPSVVVASVAAYKWMTSPEPCGWGLR